MATTNDPAAKSGPRHPLTSLHELYEALLAWPSNAVAVPENISNDIGGSFSNDIVRSVSALFGEIDEPQRLRLGMGERLRSGAKE